MFVFHPYFSIGPALTKLPLKELRLNRVQLGTVGARGLSRVTQYDLLINELTHPLCSIILITLFYQLVYEYHGLLCVSNEWLVRGLQ